MTAQPFAHRGLHGRGASENGMAAFRAAIAAGYGIECDVRASSDGQAIIFHDAHLHRMTGRGGRVDALPAAKLNAVALPDGGHIPSLAELLTLCGRKTALLIEVKARRARAQPVCGAVAQDLARHPAARAAVMSFSPFALFWFRRHRAAVPRGLIVSRQGKGRWRGAIERTLALWIARPDFLAYDIRDLPSPFAMRARARRMPVLSWTVRTPGDRASARLHADQIIFEDAGAPHG